MNYRHSFHAGNPADCLKHAVLVWLLDALARKPAPFAVLDTHAGAGGYRLDEGPALRTGEAQAGILRLMEGTPAQLEPYVDLVRRIGLYPGSPLLALGRMRESDRYIGCERHPEEHAVLRRALRGDGRASVHARDGYEAIGALLPPAERRGLVLIDPPYEEAGEFERVLGGITRGRSRFPAGIFAAWYPIKHYAPARGLHAGLAEAGLRDVVAVEMLLREPVDPGRLNGSGIVVVNPPYRFEAEVGAIAAALLDRLGARERGEAARVTRIADE